MVGALSCDEVEDEDEGEVEVEDVDDAFLPVRVPQRDMLM